MERERERFHHHHPSSAHLVCCTRLWRIHPLSQSSGSNPLQKCKSHLGNREEESFQRDIPESVWIMSSWSILPFPSSRSPFQFLHSILKSKQREKKRLRPLTQMYSLIRIVATVSNRDEGDSPGPKTRKHQAHPMMMNKFKSIDETQKLNLLCLSVRIETRWFRWDPLGSDKFVKLYEWLWKCNCSLLLLLLLQGVALPLVTRVSQG